MDIVWQYLYEKLLCLVLHDILNLSYKWYLLDHHVQNHSLKDFVQQYFVKRLLWLNLMNIFGFLNDFTDKQSQKRLNTQYTDWYPENKLLSFTLIG